ncbi:MAG: FG-GAP repeat protein, partial [Bacteroidetes bacterium]|nr:FG-GAP repeat protein [Bacteroidota bacterium]
GAGYTNLNTGSCFLYLGGSPMDASADLTLTGETSGSYFGCSAASVKDVNNDGYDDFVIGAYGYNSFIGRAYLYFGSAVINNSADMTFQGSTEVWIGSTQSAFGISVSSAGDVNGDTYPDIIIGGDRYFYEFGRADIFFGGPGMDTISDVRLSGETGNPHSFLGRSVSTLGDVNNDGFSDVVVGLPGFSWWAYRGMVNIYYGGSNMDGTPDRTYSGENNGDASGFSVACAGDFNNDGYPDLITGAPGFGSSRGRVYLYDLNFGRLDPGVIYIGENSQDKFGTCVKKAGDINKDGYDDLIIGAPGYNGSLGRAYVFYGGPAPGNTPSVVLSGENSFLQNTYFGYSCSGAGDLNKDGFDDVIVGAYGWSSQTGRAYIYFGGAGMDDIPDLILQNDLANDCFGYSVSGAGDVNGDGYSDVLAGGKHPCIYFGGNNMDNIPDLVFSGGNEGFFYGNPVSTAGDINGDGFSDVMVGIFNYSDNIRAFVYFGGSVMDNNIDLILHGNNIINNYDVFVYTAGDVNNDGYDDMAVGLDEWSRGESNAMIFFGGSIPDNIPDVSMNYEFLSDHFGATGMSEDFNGDGYSDVIFGAWANNQSSGKSYIFNGGENMDNTYDFFAEGAETSCNFAKSVSTAGDVNSDGYSDFIVGAPEKDNGTGSSYLYFGKGDPAKTLSALDLSPVISLKQVNEQICLTANVKNKLDFPLENTRINYFVKGSNERYGTGISDGSGNVQYCYTGTNPGKDTIIAVSGKLRDTAFVFWEAQFSCITGSQIVLRNSLNLYFAESNPDAYWDISNFESTQARIVSNNHNDSIYADAGNNPGHFILYYVTPDSILCTKHVYVDNPLPVELVSFISYVSGRNVTLNWSTSSELNNSGFDIERFSTENQWVKAGFVSGHGTISELSNYSFTDKNLTTGKYKYRLKQIDFNGNFEYFELAEEVSIGIPDKFELSQNYPNPFNPVTNLEFGIAKLGFVTLKIYDVLGRELITLVNEIKEPGYYKIKFDAGNLASGVYFYRMTAGDFVAVKKLVVMK